MYYNIPLSYYNMLADWPGLFGWLALPPARPPGSLTLGGTNRLTLLVEYGFISLCVFCHVKDHHMLQHDSPLSKNTWVRQVVLDKWFTLMTAACQPCWRGGPAGRAARPGHGVDCLRQARKQEVIIRNRTDPAEKNRTEPCNFGTGWNRMRNRTGPSHDASEERRPNRVEPRKVIGDRGQGRTGPGPSRESERSRRRAGRQAGAPEEAKQAGGSETPNNIPNPD